ncbi:MAG: hypothetical protein IKK40_09835, partial [Bacteroidales bacterium]|nr:hypothetical protein [Bacteroidales bacterium]
SALNNLVSKPCMPTMATYVYDLFATRAATDYKNFVADKKMLTPMQYVFWCVTNNRKFTHDDAIAGFYSCMAISFNSAHWEFEDIYVLVQNKKIKYFFHCLRNMGMSQEIMECNNWLVLVSKAIWEKMVKKYGDEIQTKEYYYYEREQKKYKDYLHQSVIPPLFPKEHKYIKNEGKSISVLDKDYSKYSFEEWQARTSFLAKFSESIARNFDVEIDSFDNEQPNEQDEEIGFSFPEAPF